ncbi:aldolase/citrate lyase family protein [Pseudochelatococcus sp. B33]
MYRLFENIRNGTVSMGLLTKGGPNLVRHQAAAGADFIIADMMHSRLEWDEAAHISWVARADGVYPFIRIQGHPWGTAADMLDRRFSVDAMRALTVGAEGVMFSVTSAAEARSVSHLFSDWHQGKPVTSQKALEEMKKSVASTRLLIPLIESRGALDEIEEIMAIDGIGGVFMAMTDLSHQLGHPHEYEHPDVWAAVDRAVALARKHNKVVVANTGYIFPTVDGQIGHASRLAEHGVNLVMLQTTEYYIYVMLKSVIDGVHANRGEVK